MVEADARFCKMVASSRDHYIYLLKELGYEVKDGERISVKAEGMKRFRRLGTIAPELDYKDTQINNIMPMRVAYCLGEDAQSVVVKWQQIKYVRVMIYM